MGKKYIKCPRCELNYILEGEDYCHICKSEMKHFNEGEDNGLLDGFDDVELCPVCGVNYIKEDETMCEECRNKKNQNNPDGEDDEEIVDWDKSRDDDSLISYDIDSDSSEEQYNPGFEEIDENSDPYKIDDDTLDDFAMPIEFSSDDDKLDDKLEDEEEDEDEDPFEDDFETIEVSDEEDEEEDEDDEDDDDYYGGMGDMLGKKK